MTQHTDAQTCHTCGGTHDNHKGSVHTCRCAGCDPQGEDELDFIDILWKRANRQGRYYDKPIKLSEFRATIQAELSTQREQAYADGYKKGVLQNPAVAAYLKEDEAREQARQEVLDELDKSMPTKDQLTTKYGYHMPDKMYGYSLALHDIREVINAKRKKGN